jgi:hypothetical protein
VASRWFSPGSPVSSTNKTDRQDIVESGVQHHQTNKQTIKIYLVKNFNTELLICQNAQNT